MDEAKSQKEYIALLPEANAFREALVVELSRLVQHDVTILSRTKAWDSVRSRMQLLKLTSVRHISDLVGIRLVVRDTTVLFHVIDTLEKIFFLPARMTQHLGPDESAAHLTVRSTGSLTQGVSAEIQVVTVAEDARLILQHDLKYKSSTEHDRSTDITAPLTAVIDSFEALISQVDVHEKRDVHSFIKENDFLLYASLDAVISEAPIGLGTQYRTDFILRKPDGTYVLVELENPRARIVTKAGEFTYSVNHALCQVEDWQEWIELNLPTVERVYPGIKAPEAWIIIGRDTDLSVSAKGRLARRNINMRGRIQIRTYDDLLREARAHVRSVAAALAKQ